jgi:NAD(P)-dependent dehydrogenase (short-subunit alcohol dehydrogenase family)
MLTWTWARRLAPFRVQVNAAHPGSVLGTQLARDLALKRGTHTAEVSAGRVGSRLHTRVPCACLC